jgi:Fe-S-cluster containining protein
MSPEQTDHWNLWYDAASNPDVDAGLRTVYSELAREIELRHPTCWISGKCCKFDAYGHRLYVTGLEIAWMIRLLDPAGQQRLTAASLPANPGCPFQVGKLCTVQGIKPLGCRIFFCDPSAEPWINGVYEQMLARLRQVHQAHDLPYQYLEWRGGLAAAREVLLSSPPG